MTQTTFVRKKKQTRQERLLSDMETVAPWSALLAVIEPHYPKSARHDRQPMPLATMLRGCFISQAQGYALSDPAMEDALYEIESMRRVAGLELSNLYLGRRALMH